MCQTCSECEVPETQQVSCPAGNESGGRWDRRARVTLSVQRRLLCTWWRDERRGLEEINSERRRWTRSVGNHQCCGWAGWNEELWAFAGESLEGWGGSGLEAVLHAKLRDGRYREKETIRLMI